MADIDLFEIQKQSAERRDRSVDFADKIATGVTISSATATGVEIPTLTDVASTILQSTTLTPSGTTVPFTYKAGAHGKRYRITVTAVLSSSEILTADVFFEVRDY